MEELQMFDYAQIDEQGYCFSKSTLSGIVEHEDLIFIGEEDVQLGQKYDRENKVWLDEFKPEEPQEPSLTLEDVKKDIESLQEDNLVVMGAQAEQYEGQEVLKQDMLAIMSAIAELYEMVIGGSK